MEKLVPQPQADFGVRIAHREVAAHQLVRVVQLRARQQVQAGRIHQDLRPARSITRSSDCGAVVQFEAILEAAASAGQHGDAQRGQSALGGDDLGDAGGGPLGQSELFHVLQHRASGCGIEAVRRAV